MKILKKQEIHFLTAAVVFLLLLAGNMNVYAAEPSIEYTLYNTNGINSKNTDWSAAGSTSQTWSEKNNYWNAISVKLKDKAGYTGGVKYATHVHNVGWSHDFKNGGKWVGDGKKLLFKYNSVTGVTSQDPWIEAISVELTGDIKNYYYVNYNAYIAPLSETYKTMLGSDVDQERYKDGMKLFNKGVRWVGFEEDLSSVIGSGGTEEGIANDGGLNFAGTWGMTMPISAFRAKLSPFQVKLTVKPNGGTYSGSTDATTSWPQADTLKSIATPKRTGYKFTGWTVTQTSIKDSKESLKKNKQQHPDNDRAATWKTKNKELQLGNKNVTLKANWEKASYTLTVKPNGGTWNGSTADQKFIMKYGETKTIADPTRTGYTFDGWTRTGSGSSLSGKIFTMGTANATLTAKWKVNSYKLTVKPNSGTWNGSTADQTFTMKYGETKTIADPTRTGYTFDGWARTGSGSSLSGKIFTMGTANATLTAKWKVNSYKLTIKPNGGTWNGSTADQTFTLKYGETKTIANPARTGYTFGGWTISGGAGSKISGTVFTMGYADTTLTAKWTINSYRLTVKPNGGTWEGKADNQNVTLNYAATKNIADPIRPGYTFIDWSVTGTGSSLINKKFTMGSANAAITANWKANTYSIVFDGNGATEGSMEGLTATVDVFPIQLPANQFKRITEQGESRFLGWALVPQPEGNTPEFTDPMLVERNLAQRQDETVTLYAIWDDCPQITAEDRYFNLFWAQNGKITEEELLRTAKAVDKEDNELENRTKAQVETAGLPGSLSLFDYNSEAFTAMTEDGTIPLTYQAVDSAGNTVYKTVQVHVFSSAAIPLPEKYTRYINRKYYEKPYEEGGLHPNSKWRTDPEYKAALEEALDNEENDTPIASYYFTHDEVEKAQEYVTEHGIGDTKEPGAQQSFFDRFMR